MLVVAAPVAAQAPLYKWVDERGVVNYGDAPPAKAKKISQLDEATSSLSVVPGLSKEELALMREREAEARIARLERELEEARALPARPTPVYDSPPPVYVPAYVQPLRIVRHPPRHLQPAPVHGTPVKRTPPMRDMKLDR
jgi:hypothetical protein